MNDEGKDGTAGMEPGDDETLWRLLGRARPPEVSPYFSRRVLREVAQIEPGRGGLGGWRTAWRRLVRLPKAAVWPGAVALGVFWLSVVLTMHDPAAPVHTVYRSSPETTAAVDPAPMVTEDSDDDASMASEDVAVQDVEVIADLDNMIAREENRLWTEDSARF